MILIFNITSITSGNLFKHPRNAEKRPKSFIRDSQRRTPFGNISQTFNLIMPKVKFLKIIETDFSGIH